MGGFDKHNHMSLNTKNYFVKAAVLQNILKIISYIFFKHSLQIYIIVVRNIKNLHIFTYLLRKQIIVAIGMFLLYIMATALVTH